MAYEEYHVIFSNKITRFRQRKMITHPGVYANALRI